MKIVHKRKKFNSRIIQYYTDSYAEFNSKINSPKSTSALMLKLRTKFASHCEKSPTSRFIEYIYRSFLSCPFSAISIFLLVFSIVSFSLRFVIAESKFDFFLNTGNWVPVILFVVALLTIPVKKELAALISKSRFLSRFEFSYDEMVLKASSIGLTFYNGFSTSFFLGVLGGIASVLFSPSKIILFFILATCMVMIINKPECGALLSIFFLPLIDGKHSVFLVSFTLIALLYKYMLGKRHISFGRDECLLLVCSIIFVTCGLATASGKTGITEAFHLLTAIFAYVCIKNLIKSFSLFNNCIRLITTATLIASVLTLTVHIVSLTVGSVFLSKLREINYIDSLFTFFIGNEALDVILAASIPINISLIFGHSKDRNPFKHVLAVLIQFSCVMFTGNANLVTASIVSIVVVLMFYKPLSFILLPIAPFIAQSVIKLINLLPINLGINFEILNNSHVMGSTVIKAINNNLLLGIGLGNENFTSCISSYALPTAENYAHPQSTLLSFILSFGLPAAIFIIIVVLRTISNNLRAALHLRNINKSVKASTAGLFGCSVCILIASTCIYVTGNAVIPTFFSIVCALGQCCENCIRSSYIDNDQIRMYLNN